MKKLIAIFAVLSISILTAAEAAAPAPAAQAKNDQPLLTWMTVDQAFARALNARNTVFRRITANQQKLQKAAEADKKALQDAIESDTKVLAQIQQSMDTIFNIGNRRVYQYNPTNGSIYMEIGTPKEAFERAIARRTALNKGIVDLQEAYKKETDAAKKAQIQKQNEIYNAELNRLVNALYVIYQIHPKRQYEYVASTGTLYIKSTPEEVEKLKKQLETLNKAKK